MKSEIVLERVVTKTTVVEPTVTLRMQVAGLWFVIQAPGALKVCCFGLFLYTPSFCVFIPIKLFIQWKTNREIDFSVDFPAVVRSCGTLL